MACSTARYPVLRNPMVRHYAVAAAQSKACPSGSAAPATQILQNKITVAALENNSPIAHISIAFRAGSRNETHETQGLSHVLRAAAGLCSTRSSYFGFTRNLQQLGANLITTSDRETISYTLQVTRNHLDKALGYLEDVATRQAFKPWEVSDQTPRVRYQLFTAPETARVIDHLHKVAYHKGLGYSVYCPKRYLGVVESEHLKYFVNKWFSGANCIVIGAGVPLSVMTNFASGLNVSSNDENAEPSKYHGGELRKDRNSDYAIVAMAVESAGLNKEKDALAFAILQQAAGTGPKVKWGSTSAPLQKAVSAAAKEEPFAVSAFNTAYSDSGLFGFVLHATAEEAGNLTRAAHKWMKSPNITDADVVRGKNELKTEILFETETNQGMIENIIHQSLLKRKITPISSIIADIDNITTADVQNVAKKLANGKVSMVSIGDLKNVPYIDEL